MKSYIQTKKYEIFNMIIFKCRGGLSKTEIKLEKES